MNTSSFSKAQEKELIALISSDNPLLIDKLLPRLQSQLLFKQLSNHSTVIEMLIKANCKAILQVLLLNHKATLISYRSKTKGNLLHMALEEKQCLLIKLIITAFAQENYSKDSEGNNELHKWVLHHSKCEKCLKALSSQSLRLTSYLQEGNTNSINPLELAASEGNESACMLLIKYFHFDYGHVDGMNETILHKIARSNLITIVDFVMSRTIIQAVNVKGETCLTVALAKGNFHFAEFFIDKGINVSKEDKAIADSMNDIPFSLAKKIRMKKAGSNGRFIRSASMQLKQRLFTDRDPLSQFIQKEEGFAVDREVEVSKFIEPCKSPELKVKNKLSDNSIAINQLELDNSSLKATPNERPSHLKPSVTSSCITKESLSSSVQFALQDNAVPSSAKPKSKLNSKMKKKPLHQTFTHLTSSMINFRRNKPTEEKPLKKNNSYHCKSSRLSKIDYVAALQFEHLPCFYALDFNDIVINKNSILHYSDHCIIYKGSYLATDVAVKLYRLDRLLPNELKALSNEVTLSINLRHPHIVLFIGICLKENILLLVTEYLELNSLKSVLENSSIQLSQKTKLRIILEIAQGIFYLHKRTPVVYHRDLKSSNVLLDSHLKAKLCDFGISKAQDNPQQAMKTNSQSTPYWMAPEFILEGRFSDKADIYSFGILMWEIIMRDTLPYKNNNMFDFILGNKEALKQRPFIPADLTSTDFTESLKQLTSQCWNDDTNSRPSIDQVVLRLNTIIQSINSNSPNNSSY